MEKGNNNQAVKPEDRAKSGVEELLRKSREIREQSKSTCEKLEELQADTKELLQHVKDEETRDETKE